MDHREERRRADDRHRGPRSRSQALKTTPRKKISSATGATRRTRRGRRPTGRPALEELLGGLRLDLQPSGLQQRAASAPRQGRADPGRGSPRRARSAGSGPGRCPTSRRPARARGATTSPPLTTSRPIWVEVSSSSDPPTEQRQPPLRARARRLRRRTARRRPCPGSSASSEQHEDRRPAVPLGAGAPDARSADRTALSTEADHEQQAADRQPGRSGPRSACTQLERPGCQTRPGVAASATTGSSDPADDQHGTEIGCSDAVDGLSGSRSGLAGGSAFHGSGRGGSTGGRCWSGVGGGAQPRLGQP